MTAQNDCPELEVLFVELAEGRGPALEHAQGCERCAAILEEHRQLEKDLFRLADPMPPPDFVHQVMARVATAPTPVRSELKTGVAILASTFVAIAGSLFASDKLFALFGVRAAAAAVWVRELFVAIGSGVSAVWSTAAIPVTALLLVVLVTSLVGLRRLANSNLTVEARVS